MFHVKHINFFIFLINFKLEFDCVPRETLVKKSVLKCFTWNKKINSSVGGEIL